MENEAAIAQVQAYLPAYQSQPNEQLLVDIGSLSLSLPGTYTAEDFGSAASEVLARVAAVACTPPWRKNIEDALNIGETEPLIGVVLAVFNLPGIVAGAIAAVVAYILKNGFEAFCTAEGHPQ